MPDATTWPASNFSLNWTICLGLLFPKARSTEKRNEVVLRVSVKTRSLAKVNVQTADENCLKGRGKLFESDLRIVQVSLLVNFLGSWIY